MRTWKLRAQVFLPFAAFLLLCLFVSWPIFGLVKPSKLFPPSVHSEHYSPANLIIRISVPVIANLSPPNAAIGGADLTLTVNGNGFASNSVVRVNSNDRTTTFVSSSKLTALIPATDIINQGNLSITVFNPSGGISNAVNLPVVPGVTGLSPATVRAGSLGFTLTVNGTNFTVGSVVRFNGNNRSTTFLSSTTLTASILATDVTSVGTFPITVVRSDGLIYTAMNLIVIPAVNNLTPLYTSVGSPAFTLTVQGAGFVNGSTVYWNGTARSTKFVNSAKLTASIGAADVAVIGSVAVTVRNPAPNNLTSNTVNFIVSDPPPATECPSAADVTLANPGLVNSGPARAQMWRTDDNIWWGAFSNNTDGIYFFKRTSATTWTKGLRIDTNFVAGVFTAGAPDCLWTGTNLFIMIQETQLLAKLYKYTYNSTTQTFSKVSGFPINLPLLGVGTSGSGKVYGTLAIDQDSNGRLWASYTGGGIGGDGNMRVIWSTSADHLQWDTNGFILATGLSTSTTEGAAIVRFAGDKIGVSWSNLNASENAFRFHNDADLPTTWSAKEVIDSGLGPQGTGSVAGKQMTMRAHSDGRIFLVSDDHDGLNNHLHLYIRTTGGVWGSKTLVVKNFSSIPSKPVLLLDTDNSTVHVIYKDGAVTSNGLSGQTFITQASMNNPAFNTACLFLDTSDNEGIQSTSNPTSTKQSINAATDLVAAASTGKAGNQILTNTVDITPNVLTIFSISPREITAGENKSALILTVNGKLFTPGATVRLNGVNRTTTFVNAGKLTATLALTDTATAGKYPISVMNPGGAVSNSVNLVVTAQNPVPTVGLISPGREALGSPQFTMTVLGSGFRRTSVVRFNGSNRTTTFVSDDQLRATIPSSDLDVPGPYPVTVFNSAPGGGSSTVTPLSTLYVEPTCLTPLGQSFPGVTLFNTVKSQMWYNDGAWWGAFSDNLSGIYFFKQNGTSYVQGPLLDGNYNGRPDVLWNGNNLFVLVYEFNTLARLYKFSYNSVTDTYSLISGFPVNVPLTGIGAGVSAAETGSITLAQDSTGKLWAAYPGSFIGGDGNYRVIWSSSTDQKTWNTTGFIFDSGGSNNTQEVAPIIHFGGNKIGIVYSKQPTQEILVRYHLDGDPEDIWSTKEVVDFGLGHLGLGGVADNHMSLRAAPDGRLFLIAKDSDGSGYLNLYTRSAAGVWSNPTLVDVDPLAMDTRPTLLLDLENSEAYVLYSDATSSMMYLNKASMNNPIFGPACPYVSHPGVWDGTSTKQNLKASMGLQAAGSTGGATSAIFIQPVTLAKGGGNVPALNNISPSSVFAGQGPFTLTVNGSKFASNAVVYINGADRATTFVSSTQLTARLMATDVQAFGTSTITVMNPKGGISGAINLSVKAAPIVSALIPSNATAGGADFTLNVNGSGFVSGAVVRFNAINRTTTFVNSTQLSAQIQAADIQFAGIKLVTVMNPDGGPSLPANFAVNNPIPAISALSPSSVAVGGSSFAITVNGSNFNSSSVINLNGAARPTTLVNTTQLTAQIQTADIATAGTFPVTVLNAAPGGGTSNISNLTVINPVPTLTTVSPAIAIAGASGFTLTVIGTNFNSGSIVRFNGDNRPTTFVGATELAVQVSAADVQVAGNSPITVFNALPGGGTSNSANFTVNNPLPTLQDINPTSATAGDRAFTLTVNGTNFVNGSVVLWNGQNRSTTLMSSTKLLAQVGASDVSTQGIANVMVVNSAPGGGASRNVSFNIDSNPRIITVMDSSAATNTTVTVPIQLAAQGAENTISFTLSYDSTLLSNPEAVVGTDVVGATLLTDGSQAAQGLYGITIILPEGQSLAPGIRQVANISFNTANVNVQTSTPITFTDQPVQREVRSSSSAIVPALYASGTVTITLGYEGDVAPRPNGNNDGLVTVADWSQISRFLLGLATANPGSEYQKADCAPRETLGDGTLTLADWVQTGRYAAGMDPVVAAGGPTGPTASPPIADLKSSASVDSVAPSAIVRLIDSGTAMSEARQITIEMDAEGNENALGFSLMFDPEKFTFVSVEKSEELTSATLNINGLETKEGRVGIVLALPPDHSFLPGTHRLVTLTFTAAAGASEKLLLGFTDQPIAREAVDIDAKSLNVLFEDPLGAGNPLEEGRFFVAQHYLDFCRSGTFIERALMKSRIVCQLFDNSAAQADIEEYTPSLLYPFCSEALKNIEKHSLKVTHCDLKSLDRKVVRVRLSPLAPINPTTIHATDFFKR